MWGWAFDEDHKMFRWPLPGSSRLTGLFQRMEGWRIGLARNSTEVPAGKLVVVVKFNFQNFRCTFLHEGLCKLIKLHPSLLSYELVELTQLRVGYSGQKNEHSCFPQSISAFLEDGWSTMNSARRNDTSEISCIKVTLRDYQSKQILFWQRVHGASLITTVASGPKSPKWGTKCEHHIC